MSAESFTAPTTAPRDPASAPPEPSAAPGHERGTSGRRTLRWPATVRLTPVTVLASLLVMVAVSVWLRTVALHFYYWVDEGISVGIASHPLSQIPGLMRQDGSPPLYYLLLHLWMSWRGSGEVATHELSVVFALLTIPATYWMGASLFGRRTGLLCAVLASGLPYLTTYATETRMYALVALLSVLVAGGFVNAFVRRRRRYLPVFSLSLLAALYSHNWALFLGVMSGVAFLWCVRSQPGDRRGLWRDGVLAFGAVALLFLPWLPTLLYQSRHTGAPWDLPPVIWSLTQGLYFLTGGRGAATALLFGGGAGLLTLWALSPASAASGVGGALAGWRTRLLRPQQPTPWPRQAAEALLILGLGTLVLAWLYAKVTPAWAPRYLAVVVGPLILLFGLGVARAGRLGLLALLLVACWWVLDPVPHNKNTKSNVASIAATVRPHLRSDPLVLSTQPEQVPTLAYYLPSVKRFATPLGVVADPRVVNWDDALARLKRSSVHTVLGPMINRLRPGQRVLLVVPANFPKTPLWMKLINRASQRWEYFLAHDHELKPVKSTNAKYYDAGSPVEAALYQRR